ncbi:MAG: hypothetical protein RL026_1263 [Pseudomonadota bacterium]|jgi:MFS family permease
MGTAGAWSPLRQPAFAVLWGAALVSNIGGWMHEAAAGWFMATLSPSPAMVALVQAAATLPVFLLSLPAGALADRMDRRRLLLAVQWFMLLLAALLGTLVWQGAAGELTLLLVTLGIGVGTAIHSPTWQSVIPQLVPRDRLAPAVALHAVGMNISRAIGPALGGLLIVGLGMAWPFWFNALTFLATILALSWWRPAPRPTVAGNAVPPPAQPGFLASMGEALAQLRDNRGLRHTLLRSVLFYAFASAYWALLPLIARLQFGGGARFFGVMVGAIGLGAVGSVLFLPWLRVRTGLTGTVLAGTLGTTAALLGYALLRAPALGIAASLLAGASWLASLSSLNVAAQLALKDFIRARGMAVYNMVFYGCLFAGSLCWGLVAEGLGLAPTLLLAAAGLLAGLPLARRLTLPATPA